MITTYALSLSSKRWSEVTRIALVDAVSDWLNEAYPYDIRPTTTTVRVREGTDDPVFRVDISESDKRYMAISQTVVTVAVDDGSLVFEIRKMLRPTGQSVLPRPRISPPNDRLSDLCLKIAKELKIRDAGQLIDGQIRIASQTLDGESLAAFAEAPGRRLPIVVELTQGRIAAANATTTLGVVLVGIAHVVHMTTNEAVKAFNEFRRERLLTPDAITIIWPSPHPPTQIYDKDAPHILAPLLEAAAASFQPVFLRPMQRSRSNAPDATKLAKSLANVAVPVSQIQKQLPDPQIAVLEADNAQLRIQVDDLTSTQDDLLESIKHTDVSVAELVDDRDRFRDQLGAILALQNPADWPRSPKEAVLRAIDLCPDLIFHDRSKTSSDAVHAPNGLQILNRLVDLNNIAARLKSERIPLHMFDIECGRQFRFATGVSDTAKNKYPDDYAIEWQGEKVYATPHIRCGDIRIHFYLDRVQLQVVIAYVGRHLRDKKTN